jgi:hypothetical protein
LNTRKDNTSGRTNVYLESATDLWCADLRYLDDEGNQVRHRKRSKDRAEVEAWLTEKERELGLSV